MIKIIVLGGGCFWCIEAVFQKIQGVHKVEPGYAGGSFPDPAYEQVCLGETDHAETVRLEYDSDKINLENILAEDYHFDYYNRNKIQPYCQFVISPKIEKIEKDFSASIK
jgi:peptide methionine sulfoxide reductase MsrA